MTALTYHPVQFPMAFLCSSSSVNVDDSLKSAITSIKKNGVAIKGMYVVGHPLWHESLMCSLFFVVDSRDGLLVLFAAHQSAWLVCFLLLVVLAC